MKKTPLLIATTNKGKVKELKQLINDLSYQVKTLDESDRSVRELKVEEAGESFAQNARIKALAYGKVAGTITLADDSGLEIDALNGDPGVKNSRYAKTDELRIKKVLKHMKNIPTPERTARFKASVGIFLPDTSEIILFDGVVEGQITKEAKGTKGFGYDPIFFSFDLGKTFAQATSNEKNRVSHRGRALEKAKAFLRRYASDTSRI